MRQLSLVVKVTVPDGVTNDELAGFVCDELQSGGGCRHPEDPLFSSLSVHSVKAGRSTYHNPDPKDIS